MKRNLLWILILMMGSVCHAEDIIIRGGTVYAWSQVGSPEEGLDCDFAPLVVEGGTIFSVGGGMGEMPSVPSNEDA